MSKLVKSIFSLTKLILFIPISIGATGMADEDCKADWNYDDSGMTVNFNDDSESDVGPITSWFWEFGDGSTSTDQNPIHIYSTGGEYISCLSITTTDGCTSEFCDNVVVEGGGDCEADFDWNDDGLTVTFEDKSDDGGATITSWAWDFGDGIVSTEANPVHEYLTDGIYITCLTITTNEGCIHTFCDEVEVEGGGGGTCEAYYVIVSNTTVDGGFLVVFDNQSTGGMAGGTTVYTWDFGDGSPLLEAEETEHLYTLAGTYMTCLTAGVEGNDCFDQYCMEITFEDETGTFDITEYPAANIHPNPASEEVFIQFTEVTSGSIELYDLYGKLIITQNIENNLITIKTDHLPSGTYLAMIKTTNSVYAQKLIVQH